MPRALASRATQTSSAMIRTTQAIAIKMTPPPQLVQAMQPAAPLASLFCAQIGFEPIRAHALSSHA